MKSKIKARDIVAGWPKSRSTMPCTSRDSVAASLAWRIFCIKRSGTIFWTDYAQRAAADVAVEWLYSEGQQEITDDFRRRLSMSPHEELRLNFWGPRP